MYKLVIMRGLPGSGKSTKAKELASWAPDRVICSADNFMINANGQYVFDSKKLPQAHQACRLMAETAMRNKMSMVIIDNTNTQHWEYKPYLDLADKFGYEVEIMVVGNLTDVDQYTERNVHGVPKESIERMAKRFEP